MTHMKRFLRTLALMGLCVVTLALCVACSAKPDVKPDAKPDVKPGTESDAQPSAEFDERSVFERGTWALSTFDGKQSPDSYTICNYEFDYNERGQIVESRKSTNTVNIIDVQNLSCTWSDDGLSYKCSYTLAMGNCGENGDSGTSKATFQVDYDELSATYTAHNERIPRIWESGDTIVRYTLEYRADGTLKHKEVEGKLSAGTLEVYDYDERGDLVRYERTVSGTPIEIKTYDITYENDVPKSATVTVTYPSKDAEETAGVEEDPAADSHTYELVLHTDDDGNVVSADSDGRGMASMSWVYIENPDSLSRLRIQAEAASAFELL